MLRTTNESMSYRSGGVADESRISTVILGASAHCPGCLAESGEQWLGGATTRHCPRCLDRIRRVYQCATWNAGHAYQVADGHASWDAFSARWRASSGLPPLSTEAVRRHVTADMIRGPLGTLLPEALRAAIHRAWCAGLLVGVSAWLADVPPPEPDGLWAELQPAEEVRDGR